MCPLRPVPRALILALVLSSVSYAGAAAPAPAAESDAPTWRPESPNAPAPSDSAQPSPDPVEVVTARLPQGRARHSYHATLAAVGGTAPYTWALSSGALSSGPLPPGLTLSTGGAISGMPTTVGTYTLTMRVTDADGATASKPFDLEIILPTPAIRTPPPPAAAAGPLSGRQLPDREVLGPGWSTHADPGGGESG